MAADHLDTALKALEEAVKQALFASRRDHKTPLGNERELIRAGELALTLPSTWFVFSGDINDFKDLNTSLGYDGADLVLTEVGEVLASFAETSSVAFRRGGDEFVILVPTDAVEAVIAAIGRQLCPLKVAVDGAVVAVSTSFGYTKIDPTLSFRENLERADKACKAAKWNHDAHPVEWSPTIEVGFHRRLRCSTCRTQISISVSPERSEGLASLSCMVCGHPLWSGK